MFKELYYWMYVYFSRVKTNDTPAFNAYLIICSFQAFNVLTMIVITSYLLKISTHVDKNTATYTSIGLAIVLLIINYFLLYAQRESIFKKYNETLPERKVKGQIYFWLYTVLSLVIFFASVANLVTQQ